MQQTAVQLHKLLQQQVVHGQRTNQVLICSCQVRAAQVADGHMGTVALRLLGQLQLQQLPTDLHTLQHKQMPRMQQQQHGEGKTLLQPGLR
jgi:hypothetical protein